MICFDITCYVSKLIPSNEGVNSFTQTDNRKQATLDFPCFPMGTFFPLCRVPSLLATGSSPLILQLAKVTFSEINFNRGSNTRQFQKQNRSVDRLY
jgi:hypothetical protein